MFILKYQVEFWTINDQRYNSFTQHYKKHVSVLYNNLTISASLNLKLGLFEKNDIL